ncbi:MAG: hypothetical protein MJ208_02000 [Bacilli bacterium]|nr:hypothetical protein [Bacilli bacterium]
MKKDRILSRILYFFGVVLLAYSLFALVYQSILTFRIDWSSLSHEDAVDMRSYVILEFVTIIFKMVIASYGIYSRHHVDETINPLFTFTIFYSIFVILQAMSLVNTLSGLTFKQLAEHYKYVISTAAIDVIVAAFYLTVTIILKMDDWRGERNE